MAWSRGAMPRWSPSPKTSPRRATSFSKSDPDEVQPATLDVRTSDITGIADPVVGQAVTAAATWALNSSLTEQYLQNIYVGFNRLGKQFDRVPTQRDPLRRRGPARQRAGRSGFGVGGTRRRPGQAGQRNLTTRRYARQLASGVSAWPPASTHSPSRPAVFRPAPGSWPGARVRRPRIC